jgi:hypothetical protein
MRPIGTLTSRCQGIVPMPRLSNGEFFYRDSTSEQIKNTAVPIHINAAAFFSPGAGPLFILLSPSFLSVREEFHQNGNQRIVPFFAKSCPVPVTCVANMLSEE